MGTRRQCPTELATSISMSNANKRIPLTEDRWKELHELKEPGQTWDELLAELVEDHKEKQLAEMIRKKREHGDFVEVDTEDW